MSSFAGASDSRAIYAAVDLLQIQLEVGDNALKGGISKLVQAGPVKLAFPLRARSEVFHDGKIAMFVHLRGHLWGYFMIYDNGSDTKIHAFMFNGGTGDFGSFKTGSPKTTIEKLGNKIVARFAYMKNSWEQVDTLALLW